MRFQPEYLKVYFIAGTQDTGKKAFLEVVETALKAGVTLFQYREKGTGSLNNGEERKRMALAVQKLCRNYHIPFIVNDDVKLALEIDADGIHVGQGDQSIQEVISLFPQKIIGLSCADLSEVSKANEFSDISYYGIGPVFGTASKEDALPPIGTERLKELVKCSTKPVVAIGGISQSNCFEVLETNAAGVAVISALTQSANMKQAIYYLSGKETK